MCMKRLIRIDMKIRNVASKVQEKITEANLKRWYILETEEK